MSQSLPFPPDQPRHWPQDAETPTGEPRFAYHRLMRRDPAYRWWRPLALGSTALGFYLVLLVVLVVAMVIMLMTSPSMWMNSDASSALETAESLDMTDPSEFILTMLSLIILIPACFVAYLLLGPKPVGLLWSVLGKLRFKWLGIATLASLIVYIIYFGISFALQAAGVIEAEKVPAESIPDSPLLMIVLVLTLVPFQAAAEEYLFRGLLMQTIGSWLRHPLFAILLPIPLFVIGHLYDVYGQIDVAVFALAAGYLTWRTGGLEAAIGLHVVNNVVLFLLGSVGLLDMNATGSTLGSLISSVCLTAVVTFLMVRLAIRFNVERTAGPAPLPPRTQYLVPWPAPQHPGYQQPPGTQAPYGYYQPQQQPTPPPPGHPTGAYWSPPPGPVPPAAAQPDPGPALADRPDTDRDPQDRS
ncbi:CPBP family intramembrane metalloprotease [Glutamicibacter sp. MNS18]|uniref:CPBP family intramembrane glutamic endopeptidase n=1 Tax=Glutamicibacter sp. MNS18 TaxID=2989817 RepID=UPI0022369B13|nr:CPBP family intramembrane glutamic endopeptidase [Glutamicibacter sp. MNS18]MCW4463902.1 CPBP family intramembrane metalloprotease [Glutamicibacter sp. MNS18]